MENYSLLMGDSSVDEDGGGVDGEAFRGTSPSGGVPEQRLLSPRSWLRDGGGSGRFCLSLLRSHTLDPIAMASTSRTPTGRGKGRGRGGRGGGSSSLPPPPSTLPLIIEEFFIVVYEDPLVKKALPKKFADYLDGQEPAKVYLRAADCGPRLWTVEVLFDGQGRMYLDKGWENFAIAHGVDFGCFVHFKYEGDDVLTVKVFDGTMCRKYYYSDDEDTDDESDDDVKPCIHHL
ncbi:hypothetical protein QYE76_004174 [Lolium multiflorum]|uniref:TF-B3 domain-containing protein n=1 Tax=Lolium multiflorum TaxID=4521 RepID=A0AAD8RRJ3_LOLMU|nr:hypothetical protein QYE76_004174 [Lolium multiflorum]